MNCEFDYCVYNQDSICLLNEIQINSLGMCEDCILVTIADEDLKRAKEKQLKDMESR